MTIGPIAPGVDVPGYIQDTAGNRANAIVVVPVNADGTPTGGTGTSSSQVQGNTASGATDAGNPVKIGGVANSAPATVTAGQRVDGWYSVNGAAVVAGVTATGADAIANSSLVGLPHAGTSSARYLIVAPSVFNGTTWDRQRGDTTGSYVVQKGTATVANNQVSVATTNTQIVAARTGRGRVTITNLGTTDVFIGATGVTTTTGQLLAGTKGASITLHTSAAIFGIVGTGTQSVSYIEEY